MAEQAKQVLQKGKSYVTIVGKASINENTFTLDKSSQHSDYIYSRLNLGIETAEGNRIFGEAMGGYSPSMNYPIKVRTKPVDGQSSNVEVAWADRLNESIVDTINEFNVIKVGLIRDKDDKLVVKKFLSAYDAIPYIKEHLTADTMVMAKGSYSFNTYKEETQRKFQINDIFLSKAEEGFANFVQTVVIDEDSLTKESIKNAKETGEITINARAVDYVGKVNGKKIGKNMLFDFPITVKIDQANPTVTQTIVEKLFKVKKNKVREIAVEGQIFEGYEQQQVNEKDIKLSKDVEELIAMGLYSKEEAMDKMTVRGNKVSKLVFTRPFILKDKDDATKIRMDVNDDKYKPEDLIVVIEEEKKEESSIDLSSIAEETSNDTGDNSWLGALGLGNE